MAKRFANAAKAVPISDDDSQDGWASEALEALARNPSKIAQATRYRQLVFVPGLDTTVTRGLAEQAGYRIYETGEALPATVPEGVVSQGLPSSGTGSTMTLLERVSLKLGLRGEAAVTHAEATARAISEAADGARTAWAQMVLGSEEAALRPLAAALLVGAYGPEHLTVQRARAMLAGLPTEDAESAAVVVAPASNDNRISRALEIHEATLARSPDPAAKERLTALRYARQVQVSRGGTLAEALDMVGIDATSIPGVGNG